MNTLLPRLVISDIHWSSDVSLTIADDSFAATDSALANLTLSPQDHISAENTVVASISMNPIESVFVDDLVIFDFSASSVFGLSTFGSITFG